METLAADVAALEAILEEFYTKSINHERRREIEMLLENWQQQDACWRRCFEMISSSHNQFLTLFCLTALETVINKKWMALPWEDRSRLKSLMFQYSLQPRLSPFIRGKAVKIVVDTARFDWPHFYPDFFTNVIELIRCEETLSTGLLYLLTISQELSSPRVDLSVVRSAELHRLLLSHVPQIFSILSGIFASPRKDISLLLRVLDHLFTWVPAEVVPAEMVNEVFRLALDTQNMEQALGALSTLNEMLYRHWTPPCWEQFLHFVMAFLLNPVEDLDHRYLKKMCDLLCLVLATQMSRSSENINGILIATYKFTERQRSVYPGLTSCLRIWSRVLDHPSANKYIDTLLTLAELIMHRVQWGVGVDLLLVEDDDADEANEEESLWQRALRICLETVARIAELKVEPVLHLVVSKWAELCHRCGELQNESSRAELLLRDTATMTRAVARLSPFWNDAGQSGPDIVRAVVSSLVFLTHLVYHSMPVNVKAELLSVHCEALAALKASCYWLPQLPESELRDITQEILRIGVERLSEDKPRRLQHCAAHLLSSLTATVRLQDAWSFPVLRSMYDRPLAYLHGEDAYVLAGALLNCLILPVEKVEPSPERMELAHGFAQRLANPLSQENSQPSAIADSLRLLGFLTRLYSSEGLRQKRLLCSLLKNPAERALDLFPRYVDDAILSQEILQFFLTLLDCLQTQVGVIFVQKLVETLLLAYSSERLINALKREDGGGLQYLLRILDLVVQTPALSAAGLTPLIVDLGLQMAQPVIQESVSAAIQEAYFSLIYSVLEHKWQYLTKGTVDSAQRVEKFLGLLRSMGNAFLLTDINLFKLNLSHFEKLNQRWKLYRTELFKTELLGEILSVLLTTLLNKSHALLADDIAHSLCHLISADPEAFFCHYLPSFLTNVKRIDGFQRDVLLRNFSNDMDLPSLTKNIFRLVNDISSYQVCNAGQV